MKQGSADDPFAEDQDGEADAPAEEDGDADGEATTEPDAGDDGTSGGTVERHSLPYIHARDGVKDGRTQRPVFLRDHVEEGIDELVNRMESELGEDVYKTDVTEAAMAVAEENPELVLAKLEEWGYGWT